MKVYIVVGVEGQVFRVFRDESIALAKAKELNCGPIYFPFGVEAWEVEGD